MEFINELNKKILILDGGFGTTVQTKKLNDEDFIIKGYEKKGCNDILVLSRPDIVEEIHREFLQAGSDIIATNTFSANAISMADYGMEDLCYQINYEGAKLARKAADSFSDRKRFVGGSMGPTNKSASFPSDFMNPAERAISFTQLQEAYQEQADGLIDGGCDVLIIETIFDSLNAKCAVTACNEIFRKKGKSFPIMISTSVNQGGRLLSGQTLEAFYHSIQSPHVISVGMNCSFGAEGMMPFVRELAKYSDKYISLYPNAGMPDDKGNYDSTPQQMAQQIRTLAEEGLVNMVGGCCGTTYHHIEAIANAVKDLKPRQLHSISDKTIFSGTFAKELDLQSKIGRNMNVTKNDGFLKAMLNEEYEEALDFACEDIDNEMDLLEICVDHSDLDAKKVMLILMRLIAARPDISSLPVMLTSNSFEAIEAGLQGAQGRHLVHYADFDAEQLNKLREFGCGIAIRPDDSKAYAMLTEDVKIPKRDILKMEEL